MNKLNISLEDVVKRVQKIRILRWVGRCFLIAISAIIIMCLIDYYFDFSITQRYFITTLWYCGVLCYFGIDFYLSCKGKITNAEAAWLIEKSYPELKESLISATEFQNTTHDEFSMKMIGAILKKSEMYLDTFKSKETFPIKWAYVKYPVIVLLLFVTCFLIPSFELPLMVSRILAPSDEDARPGSYYIELLSPVVNKAPEGQKIEFRVRIHKDNIINPIVKIRNHRNRSIAMNFDAKNNFYFAEIDKAYGEFEYWINSGRINTKKKIFVVIPRPRINSFDIQYLYPEYTMIQAKDISSTIGDLKGIVGTKVHIKLNFTKKIKSAHINWLNEEIPVELNNDRMQGSFSKELKKKGQYEIVIKDFDGLTSIRKYLFKIKALPDHKPLVEMTEPFGVLYIKRSSKVLIKWNASDDFGITEQNLVLEKNGEIESISLPPETNSYVLSVEKLQNFKKILSLSVMVKDAVGNESKSKSSKLILSTGVDISKAGMYRQKLNDILKVLFTSEKVINKISEVHALAIENKEVVGQNYEEENKHFEFQLKDLRKSLEEDFIKIQSLISDSESLHFYPHSSGSFTLMNKFLAQQITQELPAVIDYLNSKKEVRLLKESVELTRELAQQLKVKNNEYVGDIAIANVPHSDMTAMLEIGRSYGSSFAIDSTYSGLVFKGFKKMNRFLSPQEYLAKSPDAVIRIPEIEFKNVNNFSFGREPVFSGVFEGFLEIKKFQDLTLHLISDDGSRLYIDDKLLINNGSNHGPREINGKFKAKPGMHKIKIEYFNFASSGSLRLFWSGKDQPKVVVPESRFFWLDVKSANTPKILRSILSSELALRLNDFSGIIQARIQIQNRLKNDGLAFKDALVDLEEERTKSKEAIVKKIMEEVVKNAEEKNNKNKKLYKELNKTIKEALRQNDLETLKKTSELLSKIKKAEALEAFIPKLEGFQKTITSDKKFINKNMNKNNPEKNIALTMDKKSQFQELKKELKENLLNDKAAKALSELNKSDHHWKQAEKNIQIPNKPNVKKDMDISDAQLSATKKSIDAALEDWEKNKDELMKEIKSLRTNSKEMLSKVIDELKTNPDALNASKEKLKEIKDELEDNAKQEIKKKDSDLQQVKQNMLLAKNIDDLLDKKEGEDLTAQLDDLKQLNDKFKENSDETLAPNEKGKLSAEIDKRLKESFGDDILKKLNDFAALKEIKDDIAALANTSEKLEKSPDAYQSKKLEEQTNEAKKRLNKQLTPEQVKNKGNALLDEAIKDLDEIEKAIDSKNNKNIQQLAKAKNALENKLADLSALRDQIGKFNSPAKNQYEQESKPMLDKMAQKKNLTAAPKETEKLKKNLNDLKKQLNDSKKDFEKPVAFEEGTVKPMDDNLRDKLVGSVDKLEKSMLNALVAIEEIKNIKKKIEENNLKVRKKLRKMPTGNLSSMNIKKVEAFKKKAPELNNTELAQGLAKLGQQLRREDPQLRKELNELAKETQKDNGLDYLKDNKFKAQKQHSKNVADQYAKQIENELNKSQALTKNMAKALDKLRENIKKDNMDTAFKNLNNLKKQMAHKPAEKSANQTVADKIDTAKKLLNTVASQVDEEQRKKIKEALADLKKGDFQKASQLSKEVADKKSKEVKAANQFAKALQKKLNDYNHLKKAKDLANADRLNEAANEIAKSGDAKPLSKEMQRAMDSRLKAIQELQKEVAKQRGKKLAKDLVAALHNAKTNQFKKSNQRIQSNKHTPEELKKAFAKAESDFKKAMKSLDKEMASIKKDNSHMKDGLAAVKDLQKQNGSEVANTKKAIKQLEEDARNLQKALQSVQRDDLQSAKKAMGKSDQKKTANKSLSKDLDNLLKSVNEGKAMAKKAASGEKNTNTKSQLEQAAKSGKSLAQSQAHAKAAGKSGQSAANKFQEAAKNKKGLEGALAKAMGEQQKQMNALKKELNKMNSAQQQLKQAESYAKRKDFSNAKKVMDQMAKGHQQAAKANQLLDQVAQALNPQKNNSNKEPSVDEANNMQAESSDPSQKEDASNQPKSSAAQQDESMAKALDQLSKASQGLKNAQASKETTKSLQAAAKSLDQMKSNQENALMASMPKSPNQKSQGKPSEGKGEKGKPSSSEMASQGKPGEDKPSEGKPGKESSKPSSEPSESGDGMGEKSKEGSYKEKGGNLNVVSMKNTWSGVKDKLNNKVNKGSSSSYSDYYKNANQKYLQKLLKESQKWKD